MQKGRNVLAEVAVNLLVGIPHVRREVPPQKVPLEQLGRLGAGAAVAEKDVGLVHKRSFVPGSWAGAAAKPAAGLHFLKV